VNARGLVSKIDVLKQYVSEMNMDIIGIAETFLKEDVMLAEISIEGYTIYRKDRYNFKEGKGGGVILYIRNELVSYDYEELNKSASESVWCKLKIDNNSSITIGVCYRSQAASEQELQELYNVINVASQGKVLLMGDFNYPLLNWDTYECDSNAEKFRDLLLDNYLYQHVREPTRESNILDLVISSDENMVANIEVLEHLGNSDHNIIVWSLILDVGLNKTKQPFRKYYKADYVAMRNWFNEIDLVQKCNDLDVEEMWHNFRSFIDQAIDRCVPVGYRYNKSRHNPRWRSEICSEL
jgi:hypothetical protein